MVQSPACYMLRVGGHLDDHWSAWFGDLTLTQESDGTTGLSTVVADQAQLHGLLMKIRDLGVPLISVAIVGPSDGAGIDGMVEGSKCARRDAGTGCPDKPTQE